MEKPPLLPQLEHRLNGPHVWELLESMMLELTDLPPEGKERVTSYFKSMIGNLLQTFKDVTVEGDESEIEVLLPSAWLAWRLEWARYNAQMQYQAMLKGAADPELMAKGGALSYFVGQIEKFLDSETIYWLYKIAADPIPAARQRARLNERLIAITSRAGTQMREMIESLFNLRNSLKPAESDTAIVKQLDRFTNEAIAQFGRSSGLSTDDLLESMEMLAISHLSGCQLKTVVSSNHQTKNELVASDIVDCFRKVADTWFKELMATSIERTGEDRMAAGKSEHLNIECQLRQEGDFLTFEVKNDGLGRMEFKHDPTPWAKLGLSVDHTNDPGKGSKLTMRCIASVAAVDRFIVFELEDKGHRRLFGIPCERIDGVERKSANTCAGNERLRIHCANDQGLTASLAIGDHVAGLVNGRNAA